MPIPAQLPEPLLRRVMWVALTLGAVLMVAVLSYVRSLDPDAGNPDLIVLVLAAIGVSVAGLLASRLLARSVPADAKRARARFVAQVAVCEFGTLFGAVTWFLTGQPLSWLAIGVGLLGMLLAFPREQPSAPAGAPRNPMIR